MSLIFAVKRPLFALVAVVGLTLPSSLSSLYADSPASQTPPCDLPVETTSSSSETQSPEQPRCLRKVLHNGMVLCLPCPAADAHVRHGDQDLGPCTKPGNETPPGQG